MVVMSRNKDQNPQTDILIHFAQRTVEKHKGSFEVLAELAAESHDIAQLTPTWISGLAQEKVRLDMDLQIRLLFYFV